MTEREMIEKFTPYCYKMAYKYQYVSDILEVEDLVSIGQMAIVESIKTYDKSKKAKLATHIMNMIRFKILRQTMLQGKLKINDRNHWLSIQKCIKELGDDDISDEELSKYMNQKYSNSSSKLSPDRIKRIRRIMQNKFVSMDKKLLINDDKPKKIKDVLYDEDYSIEDEVASKLNVEALKKILTKYPKRVQYIFNSVLSGKSRNQIGSELGLSHQRVSQIIDRNISKIQRDLRYGPNMVQKLDIGPNMEQKLEIGPNIKPVINKRKYIINDLVKNRKISNKFNKLQGKYNKNTKIDTKNTLQIQCLDAPKIDSNIDKLLDITQATLKHLDTGELYQFCELTCGNTRVEVKSLSTGYYTILKECEFSIVQD